MEQIKKVIRRFLRWVKLWLWDKPISKPPREAPARIKATEVAKEYMVVTYHEQRVSMLKTAYPIWKMSSRKDKRATALRFKTMEKKGHIRFEEIEGNLICIKNKDYQELADQAKEKK